ncbi:cytochrome P450 [Marmoricola endophyticus]|uniref:Cytochrome P450 n=1 Tax=Marmoricola endophyticus TaxID=2040280 RepID=A0A917F5V6_9ACTN|nr:cytochrome P450 [Marmoricola endophyticus]GGF46592.1 cytochrome P450 [Marmoricola endophyticus]
MTVLDADPARPQLPFGRPNLLDLAPLYDVLRREAPITAVTTPAGDPAWLVTRFEEVRSLLADKRLGRSHPDPENASRINTSAVLEGPSGDIETEEREHTRMRRLLTPAFSAKRMRTLEGRVQQLIDGYVDALVAEHDASPDGVADLHATLAFPLPVAVICTLLGVPESDGDYFSSLSERMSSFTGGDAQAARREFHAYMGTLAEAKRTAPGEDVITDLVRAYDEDPDFSHDELVRICTGLLFAGHETTVNRIGLGTLMLSGAPDQWRALVEDPEGRVNALVEEMMRLGAPGDLGLLRYAHTDVEVGEETIRTGDAVMFSINAANRDPEAFADAEDFVPDRQEKAHVGFGHGGHFCIGASLARTELRATFATLARRLPGLRLAVALDDIEVRETVTGGVRSLPVTWTEQ